MGERCRVHVCWFKRDLRVDDHRALASAVDAVQQDVDRGRASALVCLYCHEPSLLVLPEHDPSHAVFVNECLVDLRGRLRHLGGELFVRHAEVASVLGAFASRFELASVHAHEETGLLATFERDKRVAAWCAERCVAFVEHPQHGVVRRLKSRNGWARRWNARMDEDLTEAPSALPGPPDGVLAGEVPSLMSLALGPSERDLAQRGGEREGRALLASFLQERGEDYRRAMSSPVFGEWSCARVSAHLAYGSVSLRRAHHETEARLRDVREGLGPRSGWALSLASFAKRLRWHCHFMQKLEDEPSIEWRNFSRAYDGLRTEDVREWTDGEAARFEAWCEGRTGYPMVDASMRCLHRTGWINFRMRAMLVSFAAYHLWLHWKPVAEHLARHFVDFEPGIHYSQCQMQSGTTGINTVRIYSPAKQARDNDPGGVFVRRWVPELAEVPDEDLAEPHRMEAMTQHFAGCRIGVEYPEPIVDHATAYRRAKERVFALRGTGAARDEARRVQQKHGSRRGARRASRRV